MFRIWVGVWACASFVSSAQTENELLNRDFWKTGPTLEHVRELVEAGNDPTSLNQFDFDPLSWALIENAETNVLEFLLEFDGNGVNKLTHDERTYVFWAAYRDNLDFMMELARRGARFDLIDEHGYSLLNFAAVTGQTNAALYDYILSQGGDPSVERNHDGAHALHLVAPFLTDEEMIAYFEPHGLSLTDTDDEGSNGWLYACKGGRVEMLKSLLEKGMDANYVNAVGENAAHSAVRGTRGIRNGMNVFKFLEQQGVDLHAANLDGVTPIMQMVHGRFDADALSYLIETAPDLHLLDAERQSVMHHALAHMNVKACEILLEHGWAMGDAGYRGSTLLQALASGYDRDDHESFEILSSLLKAQKVPLAQVLTGGEHWLHIGARSQSLDLLKFGLVLGLDVNQPDESGMTPLHEACLTATDGDLIQWLVAVGADIQATTHFGETPADLASENEAFTDGIPESLMK